MVIKMTVQWDEAVANSGRFAWQLDAEGKRSGPVLQFGKPFMWRHFDNEYPAIRWSDGVSEGWIGLDNLTLEWESE